MFLNQMRTPFRFGVIAALFLGPLGLSLYSQEESPDLSRLNYDDRSSIQSVCAYDKFNVGPAAYHQCLERQLRNLGNSQAPDLSGLNYDDRASIQSACAYDKFNVGPAAYHQCLEKQLRTLGNSQAPDLSRLNYDDRSSIQSACAYDKFNVGPAAYHACVAKQLRSLSATRTESVGITQAATVVHAQTQTGYANSPSVVAVKGATLDPKVKRLSFLAGIWTLTGDVNPSSFGPGGKLSGTHRNELQPDGSIVSHWDEQRSGSSDSGQATYAYDSNQQMYIYDAVNSAGEKEHSVGTVEGNTWTWTSSPTMESGETVQCRFTVKELSAAAYSFRFESAATNGDWTTVIEGSATKAK